MIRGFELDTPWQADAAEGLGVWSLPAGAKAAVKSGASPEPEGMPGWCIDLPSAVEPAERLLRAAQEQLQLTTAALDAVPQRLKQLVEQVSRTRAYPAAAPGPAAAVRATWPAAERELWRLLLETQSGVAVSGAEGAPAAPAPPVARAMRLPGWRELEQRFRRFIEQLQHWVLHFAYVETRADGRLVARTTVSWTGDFASTYWRHDADATSRHRRATQLAVATRMAWLRIVVLTAEAAAKLAAAFALPFGSLTALPVAWWYIRRILDELPASS